MSLSNPIEHIQQQAIGYCLPACAQMALAQFDIKASQKQLAQALGARAGIGTPFPNIIHLNRWRVHVETIQWQSIDAVASALAVNRVVIVAVTTTPGLPEWGNIRTQHAVLVVAVNPEQIVYHDPALQYGPVSAPCDEFLLAWSEMAEQAALLSRM